LVNGESKELILGFLPFAVSFQNGLAYNAYSILSPSVIGIGCVVVDFNFVKKGKKTEKFSKILEGKGQENP